MKNFKYLVLIAFVAFIFNACNKDKKDEFTPEKAKEALNQASDIILTYVEDVKTSKAFNAANSAGTLTSSYKKAKKQAGVLKQNFRKVAKVFKNTIHRKAKKQAWDGGKPFNMSDYAGTYEWNADSMDWIYTPGEPADKIVVKFPYDKSSTTNNAVFTLYKYTEQEFSDSWGTYYQPTSLSADLYVDENKEASVDLSITYDETGDMPITLSVNMFMNPFTETLNYTLNGTTLSYSTSISKDGVNAFSSSADLVFASTDYEDVNSGKGFIQVANLKITANADMKNINDQTTDDMAAEEFVKLINENVQATIYTYPEENKIGDLSLTGDNEENMDILITYSDGSSESAQPYFDKISQSLNELFDEMESWDFPEVVSK